jgi:hypothetical protein
MVCILLLLFVIAFFLKIKKGRGKRYAYYL